MRRPRPFFGSALSLTTALSLTLPLALSLLGTARAQTIATPPARVGQVAAINGQVSFADSNTNGWAQASLNYPIVSGDALYTQPGAQTAVAIDASRITLNSGAELTFTRIGNRTVTAALAQGEIFLDLRYMPPGDSYSITTPRGTVTLSQNGRYDIIAGDANTPTEISTLRGNANLQTQDVALSIAAGQTAYLQGSQPVTASLTTLRVDPFINSFNQRHYIAPPSYVPPVVDQMTGITQLSAYGAWQQAPQYGAIWYPTVAPGWVPYHYGHWAYIAPWGWTWVDNEPWGFAPFHYGRWVQYGGRWGWAPAYAGVPYNAYQPPVYAPALVSFFSVGSGVALSVGLGVGAFAQGNIGWVPLGPQEPYLPWYRCRPDYVRNLNVYNVRNINRVTTIYNNNTTVVNNTRTINNYYGPTRLINRGAATVIPASAMRQGLLVQNVAHAAPQTILAAAHPIPPASVPGYQHLQLTALHPGPIGRPIGRPGAQPGAQPGIGPNHGALPQPGQPIHAIPAVMRLPAPPAVPHRIAAPAPRPAPFAAARGLPVAKPGPVHGIAARPVVLQHMPTRIQPPHSLATPTPFNRPVNQPAINRPTPAIARPTTQPFHPPAHSFSPPPLPHVVTPQPLAPRPAAPQYHPPVQTYHPPVQTFHPPVQAYHPPVQTYHPPVQTYHPPVQAYHPPVQAYHPPVQAYHPPVQTYHPPVQAYHPPPRPAPRPAPPPKDLQHP
ncbi:hypothetical protein ACOSOMT5_P0291 [Acidiphilium sp. MT5]